MSASNRGSNKKGKPKSAAARGKRLLRSLWWVVLLLALGSILFALLQTQRWSENLPQVLSFPAREGERSTPTRTARPSLTPRRPQATPVVRNQRVGIIAGHSGPEDDPGAVCESGLREADVNMAVAKLTAAWLRDEGYEVDLLEEFDSRLKGYEADALVAIHADSCIARDLSGFKVARAADSAIPQAEDRLVQCLYQEYEAATGLLPHPSTITGDMENYHAFREIKLETPGVIIELGFLLADGHILANETDRMAYGIVSGVRCFLE
jgi:N-acetylmuramoyl-L-alanine amidase